MEGQRHYLIWVLCVYLKLLSGYLSRPIYFCTPKELRKRKDENRENDREGSQCNQDSATSMNAQGVSMWRGVSLGGECGR
ncbi:hypothetical protein R3P38DRAFT_1065068 [Favolaschia claudopus]|uniref:Secreted protein n=1 Tax=Favolaschia claudopus TaxID=2862362 RepID=A0AAW0BH29_9AGAR